MVVSNRDSKAGSRSSLRLVAPMMMLFLEASKPSISRSSTPSSLRVASCMFPFLLVARLSISSKKTMAPSSWLAALNTVDSSFSDSPYHFDPRASRGTYTRGTAAWLAITRAEVVLPVPGGPSNSTARGRLDPACLLVPFVTASNTSGCCRGNRSPSVMTCFCSWYPCSSPQSISPLEPGGCTTQPIFCSLSTVWLAAGEP
mmetsp:Transcript_6199/g.17790  ORF Transcript_6199/g.17790 Transcript_6199/m.17790 type:complete len:201 (+) Transcript_6199:784-1386(+)